MIQIFGTIEPPPGVSKYIPAGGEGAPGLTTFLNNILKLLIIGGGLFAFFNIVIAGYGFMSAGDDPQKMENAWKKIWQSLIGLLFVAGSFVLASIFGWLIFGDPRAILMPEIYGP